MGGFALMGNAVIQVYHIRREGMHPIPATISFVRLPLNSVPEKDLLVERGEDAAVGVAQSEPVT